MPKNQYFQYFALVFDSEEGVMDTPFMTTFDYRSYAWYGNLKPVRFGAIQH